MKLYRSIRAGRAIPGIQEERRMSTRFLYTLPVEQTGWTVEVKTETLFTWEYEDPRSRPARSSSTPT